MPLIRDRINRVTTPIGSAQRTAAPPSGQDDWDWAHPRKYSAPVSAFEQECRRRRVQRAVERTA